jgi:polysaccharide pyruvyl transferase WcaK-like protein
VESNTQLIEVVDAKAPQTGGPRIALLSPYSGHNLGDAAIQDAAITNLKKRLPNARFSGITLNCDNFIDRHGDSAFPLTSFSRPLYGMCHGTGASMAGGTRPAFGETSWRRMVKRVPGLWNALKTARAAASALFAPAREIGHWVRGYAFLRGHQALIVCGGGQLDEEWGGTWGHPFELFKWALLARLAGVPYLVVSVGVCKTESPLTRRFLAAALKLASYRSYRDPQSRTLASQWMPAATVDRVSPDLAFSLSVKKAVSPLGLRSRASGRRIVGLSLIAFGKPGHWPYQNPALYYRYLDTMSEIAATLLSQDYFIVLVWSDIGDHENVTQDLLSRLDPIASSRLDAQMYIPGVTSWRELAAAIMDVDLLVASRLHSVIFGFATFTPTIAISFDPKVDWVVQDLGQERYLFSIRGFTATEILDAVHSIERSGDEIRRQLEGYQNEASGMAAQQYDAIGNLIHRRVVG